MRRLGSRTGVLCVWLALAASLPLSAQAPEALFPGQQPVLQMPGSQAGPPLRPLPESQAAAGPVAHLYRNLRAVPLDAARVFHVREASLDRGELHLYLTDGTIAFTRDVEAG